MSKRVVVPEPLPDGCCHPSCPFYSEGEWSGPKCWAKAARPLGGSSPMAPGPECAKLRADLASLYALRDRVRDDALADEVADGIGWAHGCRAHCRDAVNTYRAKLAEDGALEALIALAMSKREEGK